MANLKENLEILQQKAKERTVKTQNIEYDLETLVKKIEKKVIKLNPDYQRNHRWTDDTSSRLIESLILNIPIPLIYISQDIDVDDEADDDIARYSVIDGQQRLTAIYKFFKNEIALTELDSLKELNGTKYKDLPPFLIRRLEERTIKCLRIDSTVDSEVKYDIFERLNSGSVKLEAQEVRNATCRGPFRNLIKELGQVAKFLEISILHEQDSNRLKKMEDQELILRFFSLYYNDGYIEYKGGFKNFLTAKMNEFNKLNSDVLNSFKEIFLNTIDLIHSSIGVEPFSKYKVENGDFVRMSRFNAAVYDSVIVPFANIVSSGRQITNLDANAFKSLFQDQNYFSSVEGSVNDASKLQFRIKKVSEFLDGYISK